MKKQLLLITAEFPYGKSEVFLEKELLFLLTYYSEIHIFPLSSSDNPRILPDNCFINDLLCEQDQKRTAIRDLFKWNFLVPRIFLYELFFAGRFWAVLKSYRNLISLLTKNIENARNLKEFVGEQKFGFYSVWNNEGALIFTMLKKRGAIHSFVFRFHGYDLFDSRNKFNYVPFKAVNLKFCKKAIVLSKAGMSELLNANFDSSKLELCYFGTFDHGVSNLSNSLPYKIVSCSNLVEVKRVELILETLKHVKSSFSWVHFGGGILLEKLKTMSDQLPDNCSFNFVGSVNNEAVIQYYKNNDIDLFIHLSESEGLGVALIEAISFGIPVLACDTGGVPEIVNEHTGWLIPIAIDPIETARRIDEILKDQTGRKILREKTRLFWQQKFNANIVYKNFAKIVFENA